MSSEPVRADVVGSFSQRISIRLSSVVRLVTTDSSVRKASLLNQTRSRKSSSLGQSSTDTDAETAVSRSAGQGTSPSQSLSHQIPFRSRMIKASDTSVYPRSLLRPLSH